MKIDIYTKSFTKWFEYPACHTQSELKFDMQERVTSGDMLGIKQVSESPLEIRIFTEDGKVIKLEKEVPTMVLTRDTWTGVSGCD